MKDAVILLGHQGPRRKFKLDFDWSNVTPEEMQELASQTMYIKALAKMRKENDIPAEGQVVTVRVSDMLTKSVRE